MLEFTSFLTTSNQVNLRSTRTSIYPTRVKDKKYYDHLQDSSDDEGQGEKSLVKATQQRQATLASSAR